MSKPKAHSVRAEELLELLEGLPRGFRPADGIMLQRICFWHQNATTTIVGTQSIGKWATNTYAAWAKDAVFLSTSQARRAIERLREGGIITTRTHLFQGRMAVSVHLTPAAATMLGLGAPGEKGCSPVTGDRVPGMGDRVPGTGDRVPVTGDDSLQVPLRSLSGSTQALADAGIALLSTESDPGEEEDMTTAREVQESLEKDQKRFRDPETLAALIKTAAETDKPSDFEEVMKCAWVQAGRQDKPRPLIVREKGQLRDLHGFLAGRGLVTPEVLAHVVMRWTSFSEAVKEEAGHWKAPVRPQVAYILKYRDTLADWFESAGNAQGASVPARRKWKHRA